MLFLILTLRVGFSFAHVAATVAYIILYFFTNTFALVLTGAYAAFHF